MECGNKKCGVYDEEKEDNCELPIFVEKCKVYEPLKTNKEPLAEVPCSAGLSDIIHNLEYAAYNLCEKTDDDVEQEVIDSTCPETSLFIAIRELKKLEGR